MMGFNRWELGIRCCLNWKEIFFVIILSKSICLEINKYLLSVAVVGLKMEAHCIDRHHFQSDSWNIDWQLDLIHMLMQMQRQLLVGSVCKRNMHNQPNKPKV